MEALTGAVNGKFDLFSKSGPPASDSEEENTSEETNGDENFGIFNISDFVEENTKPDDAPSEPCNTMEIEYSEEDTE